MVLGFLLGVALFTGGCTTLDVGVRHERPSRVASAPDTLLFVEVKWQLWDAKSDWLADKVKRAVEDALRQEREAHHDRTP